MPIPKPRPNEQQDDYISRCMDSIGGEYEDTDQAVAVCFSTWRESRKRNVSPHEQLLKAIRERQEKKAEFNTGIITADRYVKTLQECVGSDLCYRYAAKGNVSFDDAMRKAADTLTYNNPDMVVLDSVGDWKKEFTKETVQFNGDRIELPKHTLMVIRHVLTTPRKDRDGDILRTQGAKPDPKMPLLWQHVHTLPIGKMLGVAEHTSEKLCLYSAIVDLNELSHDAAVMVDNEMGRFSHGFRALEFEKIKEEEGQTTSPGGFDIKVFEIMEESLVSVPSNTDAETEEIMLSLIEAGKMKSAMMKDFGRSIREHRPKQFNVPVNLDLNVRINGKSIDENQSGNGSGTTTTKGKGCPCGGGAPKETDEETGKEGTTDSTKMMSHGDYLEGSWEYIQMELRENAVQYLSSHGVVLDDADYVSVMGTFDYHAILCVSRSYKEHEYYKAAWKMADGKPEFMDTPKPVEIESSTEVIERVVQFAHTKAGRVLSRQNYEKLVDVKEDMEEIHKQHVSTRSGKAMCKICIQKLGEVIDKAGYSRDDMHSHSSFTVEQAMTKLIMDANSKQRKRLLSILSKFDELEERDKRNKTIRSLLGRTATASRRS